MRNQFILFVFLLLGFAFGTMSVLAWAKLSMPVQSHQLSRF